MVGIQLVGFGEKIVKVKSATPGHLDSPIMEASYSILPQAVSTLAGSSHGLEGSQDGFGTYSHFSKPMKLVISPDHFHVYIADTGNDRIRKFDMRSGFSSTLAGSARGFNDGNGTTAHFNQPSALALTKDGKHLYVCDRANRKIRKVRERWCAYVLTWAREGLQGS